ncbi:DMT family transporter [Companilactobacillus pabuli]|jgi:drug/metabolite transporter (DMT)-like permease|uniref:DMT family transporter n=1 Tax=Companilactobacillus pabuli TaxID=2714036 RepID=UPI00065B10C4|nr:DMT family transporter [Companilactobacillus pabuli]AKP02698.1 membrane protein [Companilactobacillus farciminis]AKS50996.1 membrane protein [Companilactobacillus farciminis]MDG5114138.1 DMT family transporter [Companilactobacillus pabuli]
MDEGKKLAKKTLNRGFWLAFCASALWGVSGTVLQVVAKNLNIPAMWFIATRTTVAGIILLAVGLIVLPSKEFFAVFKNWKDLLTLVSFAVFGLLANMFTFFHAIKTGNSSTATILQYLSPLFIMIGLILFTKKKTSRVDVISFVLALIGVVLMITRGDLGHLSIPMVSVLWGIGSGITAALYVVIPQSLIAKYHGILITGWGMLIAGIISNFFSPIWVNPPKMSTASILGIGTVILLGTVSAFLLMVLSTKYTTAAIISITDAVQPFTTLVLSVIFLHYAVNLPEIIGAVIVVLAIYVLNRYDTE